MIGFSRGVAVPSRIRGEEAVWAIGDVHGCDALLKALLAVIDSMRVEEAAARVILLGDYVDRGPRSREVMDLLIAVQGDDRFDATFIRGNHDHMMLSFLDEARFGPGWVTMEAAVTLQSYGVRPCISDAPGSVWREVQAQFQDAVPEAHVAFLRGLEPSVGIDDYFFTHAGVRPGRSLDKQRPEDLMWIRNRFLEDKRRLSKVIVHGHTPTSAPHSDARRIGVDTGAYSSGVLTAVRLSGADRRFLQVRGPVPGADVEAGETAITAVWDAPSIVAV